MIQHWLLRFFLWAGAHLFGNVLLFAPNDEVLAIHFYRDKVALARSMHEHLEGEER